MECAQSILLKKTQILNNFLSFLEIRSSLIQRMVEPVTAVMCDHLKNFSENLKNEISVDCFLGCPGHDLLRIHFGANYY